MFRVAGEIVRIRKKRRGASLRSLSVQVAAAVVCQRGERGATADGEEAEAEAGAAAGVEVAVDVAVLASACFFSSLRIFNASSAVILWMRCVDPLDARTSDRI